MRADIKTRFKSIITKTEIDLIKRMKSEGKQYPDIFYEVLKLRPEVNPVTIRNWINKY